MAEATIRVNDNGPLVIRGQFTLTDGEGNAIETADTIALCRCGQSNNKPFCDATHRTVGFESVCRRQE